VEIKANNENNTVFNLRFENGLPYKPIIRAEPKLFAQKQNANAGVVRLEIDEFPQGINPAEISFQRLTIDNNEIYADIGGYYIVAWHGSDFIYKSAEKRTLFIGVYHKGDYVYGAVPQ